MPDLQISTDKVCHVIVKARAFDAKDVLTDPDEASNASDDGMVEILEDHGDDATEDELAAFVEALNFDEQVDLVALTWLGRGDATLDDWSRLRAEAEQRHNSRTAEYLLGMPQLGDLLEEGLTQFGLDCEGFELGRL